MAPYSCGPFSTRPMPWFTSLKAIRQTGSLREGTQTLLAKGMERDTGAYGTCCPKPLPCSKAVVQLDTPVLL